MAEKNRIGITSGRTGPARDYIWAITNYCSVFSAGCFDWPPGKRSRNPSRELPGDATGDVRGGNRWAF